MVRLDPAPGSVLTTPPQVIRVEFSEPAAPVGRGIDVYAPDGRRVSGKATAQGATLFGTLGGYQAAPEGTYLVTWRVVAQDTHPSRGTYTFSVGHAGPAPAGDPASADLGAVSATGLLLQALARWLHFLGFALSFGVLAFLLIVLRALEPPPRLRRLVYLGIVLLLVAEPVALAAQAASLGTIDSSSLADVLGSAFGRVLALRLAGPLLLWGILGLPAEAWRKGAWSVVVVGALLALVDGLAGHTVAGLPVAAGVLLTAVHVAAMVVWVGGLAALLAVIGEAPDRQGLVVRFGRAAATCVAVLILGGGLLALAHLRSPADLMLSSYGLVLSFKLVAVAAAFWLAWRGLRRLRSGRPELLALGGVVALAALLASLPPPR
ncbi:MAG: copper resistance protein CopC/CopD [Candidatus Dormibacteraeota bacterium]|nr:copper resistance protein CopC/CopD [Candidatus Dormibacteraeota bacterium]